MTKYFPLHCHSYYSLLDGLSSPKEISKRVADIDLPGASLTDHGSLAGTIQFLQSMRKAGLKAILGIEFYVCDQLSTIHEGSNRNHSHLLILAKNTTGWYQLLKLVGKANERDSFYYKPRLSLDEIGEFCDGNLIGISGHLGSTVGSATLKKGKINIEDGYAAVIKHIETFGIDNFYLECQLIDRYENPDMMKLSEAVREISEKTYIPIVGTPDSHYTTHEQAEDQQVLLATNLNKTLDEVRNSGALSCFFKSNNYHIPTYDEMLEAGHTEKELANTLELADKIEDYDILKHPQLPNFPLPEGFDNADNYLRQLCRNGWKKKIQHKIPEDQQQIYVERIKEELDVIQGVKLGDQTLSGYFLIVKDILDYIQSQNWLVGPGRGSAAGCLVSYLSDITQVDPIKYGLLFSRFYNKGRNTEDRIALPDIDVDTPSDKKEEVLEYIKNKYGHDRVGQIATYQTLKGRACLKAVLRAHDSVDNITMDLITKKIPDPAKVAGELKEMKEETGESSLILFTLENDVKGHLKDFCFLNQDKELEGPLSNEFAQAMRLEGCKTFLGRHACGIIVGPRPLNEICPMVYNTKSKQPMCALEMEDCESIGLMKLDILSLNLLCKLDTTRKLLSGEIE
jgi:DNA polymerase-3 subunit alpha